MNNYSQHDKKVTINIKITKSQRDWLAKIASQIRENNFEPVPPGERVYPQHLIGVAITLLENTNLDWTQIRNIQDVQKKLNL